MNKNHNVVLLNNKVEIGSTVVTGFSRKRAVVLDFVDDSRMTVRWEASGEVQEVLRIAFVNA